MYSIKNFLKAKEKALNSLERAKNNNLVDEKIIHIIELINKINDYYTSSSCAGRIVLIELPQIGNKIEAKFLGKWHNKIEIKDINLALEKAKTGLIWLLSQSPIIHIGVNTIKAADDLLKKATSSGFKNSGLKSVSSKIIVEICSTERLDVPIGLDGKLLCNKEYLNLIIKITNDIIDRSNIKLNKFQQKIEKSLSISKTTQH